MAYRKPKYEGQIHNTTGINRRGFLLGAATGLALLAGTAGIVNNLPHLGKAVDWYKKQFQDVPEDRAFRAVLHGGNLYVQRRVGDHERVFKVGYELAERVSGFQHDVQKKNPHYIRAEIDIVGILAEQLYENKELRTLMPDKPTEPIIYDRTKTVKRKFGGSYPVLTEIGRGTLEQVVLKK